MGLFDKKKAIVLCVFTLVILTVVPVLFISYTHDASQEIFLTDIERNWLIQHEDQIKIGYTTDYPPIEFLEDGNYVGLSADYFHLLEKKLDISIEMVEFEHWNELIEKAKYREISGITAASKTPERSEYLDFTLPYILNPNVIVTRKNFSKNLTFDELADSTLQVLAVEGYAIIEYINKNYPDIHFSTVLSPEAGLRKVSLGESDAMVLELMSASSSIQKYGLSNLTVNTETSYESNLSIATRNDWPMLNTIFNKGLSQITEEEHQAIKEKWLPFERKTIFDSPYFSPILIAILFLLIAILISIIIWNYALKKAVLEKTSALEDSKNQLLKEIEERKKTESKIIYKSNHDELTGLYNRAYFNEKYAQLDHPEYMPLSLLLADVNGLKITNDTLGHKAGDTLLIQFSQVLKNVFRDTDIIARIGGDEFVVLMPNTSKENALKFCQRVKDTCNTSPKYPIRPSVALGHGTKENISGNLDIIFKHAEDKMYEHKISEKAYISKTILDSFQTLLRETTNETFEHSERIRSTALQLGIDLGLDKQSLDALSLLADVHDLGKLAIAQDILYKTSPLSEDEWTRVKKHPELGHKIANALPELSHIATSILSHHERFDGFGYPNGLSKEQIPLLARIISIADAYDVMRTGRPYKSPISKASAIEELKKCAGQQFDSALVDMFIANLLKDNSY